jgi:hypothetical protein
MVLLTPSVLSCSTSTSTSSYTFPFSKTRKAKNSSKEKSHSLYCDDNSSLEYLLLSKDQSVIECHRPAIPLPRRQSWSLLSFRTFTKQSQSQEEKGHRAFYLLAAATNAPLGSSSRDRKVGNIVKMSSSFPTSSDGLFGSPAQTGTQGERRRSFGIGGAGNIRK